MARMRSSRYVATSAGVRSACPLATAIWYSTAAGSEIVDGGDGAAAGAGAGLDGAVGADGAAVSPESTAALVYEHTAYMYSLSCMSISSGGMEGTRMLALSPLQHSGSLPPPSASSWHRHAVPKNAAWKTRGSSAKVWTSESVPLGAMSWANVTYSAAFTSPFWLASDAFRLL
jgi:hypothetical protein